MSYALGEKDVEEHQEVYKRGEGKPVNKTKPERHNPQPKPMVMKKTKDLPEQFRTVRPSTSETAKRYPRQAENPTFMKDVEIESVTE